MKLPSYSAQPTAEELAAASIVAAKARCEPLLNLLSVEINKGVSDGLGFINAKKTLAKLRKYKLKEREVFVNIINKELALRHIMIEYNSKKLYVIWNTSGWRKTNCRMVVLYRTGGLFGFTVCSDGLHVFISHAESGSGLNIGDILLEVNGQSLPCLKEPALKLINMYDKIVLKILQC
jgi:hypothetical protein